MNVKEAISEHGNKLFNGLSAATLVWMYATFPTKDELRREIAMEHQRCTEARCERWQDAMNMFRVKGDTRAENGGGTNWITFGPLPIFENP